MPASQVHPLITHDSGPDSMLHGLDSYELKMNYPPLVQLPQYEINGEPGKR